MFDDFFGGRGLGPLSGSRAMTPTVDVADNDKELVITAELPGLDEKDFEVTLAGDVLTIKGEKKSESKTKTAGHAMSNAASGRSRARSGCRSKCTMSKLRSSTTKAC